MTVFHMYGFLINEPAAMTLAALLLSDAYFQHSGRAGFKYLTIGVLFVNLSRGGVLTSYAAPPVLMVAATFEWDTLYMLQHFGWRAAAAVFINATLLTFIVRAALVEDAASTPERTKRQRPPVPPIVIAVHVLFLLGIVLAAHHPVMFLGMLMMFFGYAHACYRH